ncbi:MAG TPA: helix-hairpin-helix domain-containing protein [Pyrinomonadaceae bacterium]|jgi:competence ComEA-like helix-hairpin-helix protein
MQSPTVKINSDPAEKISELHGIGAVLAARIVEYRERNGYFRSPEELDKVEGVSINLARSLSPHIDWGLPEATAAPVKRDWGGAVFFLVGACVLLWLGIREVMRDYPGLRAEWRAVEWAAGAGKRNPAALKDFSAALLISVSGAFNIMMAALLSVAFGLREVAATESGARRAIRASKMMVLSLLVGFAFLGLGNFFYHDLYTRRGLLLFVRNKTLIAGLLTNIEVCLFFSPVLFLLLWPAVATSRTFQRVYDWLVFTTFLTIALLSIFFATFISGEFTSVVVNILLPACSVVFGILASASLIKGKSIFQVIVDLLEIQKFTSQKSQVNWLRWLNTHLPDPEQQMELKKALNKAYPQTRLGRVTSILVFGVGSWIALQTLSAVLQWAVGKLLDTIGRGA